jgi:N-acetylglucosamine kinase-like BadF-type ATPase
MNVLGIDAGGTRTVCLLVDDSGKVLGDARGPGANLQSAGELEVEKVLHDVIGRALGHHPQPKAICLGMAGVDRPGESATIRQILERIGHRAQVLVVNDALIALEAGVPGGAGTVVVAGTGSIAYGRDATGRAARSGGWGYVLGDEGSGYWIARQALRAVVRASDGRGPATSLTARVLAHYHLTRPQDLVHAIYHGGSQPSAMAALAREVEAAATDDDAVALRILAIGALELADAAASVARRLELDQAPCRLVLAGRILRMLSHLRARMMERLTERLPLATPEVLDVEPACGAVRLALAAAHDRLALPVYLDASAV